MIGVRVAHYCAMLLNRTIFARQQNIQREAGQGPHPGVSRGVALFHSPREALRWQQRQMTRSNKLVQRLPRFGVSQSITAFLFRSTHTDWPDSNVTVIR